MLLLLLAIQSNLRREVSDEKMVLRLHCLASFHNFKCLHFCWKYER